MKKLNDEESRKLSEKDLKELIAHWEETDRWAVIPASQVKLIGIDNIPILNPALCAKLDEELSQERKKLHLDSDGYSEAAAANGLLAVIPFDEGYQVYPIRYTAELSLCKRARISGPALSLCKEDNNATPLSSKIKAYIYNECLSVSKKSTKVLVRDEKIGAFHSGLYAPASPGKCIGLVEEALERDYSSFSFNTSEVSHEYLAVDWLITDPIATDGFVQILNKHGVNKSVKMGLRFYTSDTARSSAQVVCFYDIDGVRTRLGGSLKSVHNSEDVMENFKDSLDQVGALFKEAEDQIENLGNTDIKNPSDCLINIYEAKLKGTGFSQKIAEELAGELPNIGCTGIDVYLKLAEATERTGKQLSLTQRLDMEEAIARCAFCKMSDFDFARPQQ